MENLHFGIEIISLIVLISIVFWLRPRLLRIERERLQLERERIQLERERIGIEKAERAERTQWLAEQQTRIADVSASISKQVSKDLSEDVEWAGRALELARLKPSGFGLAAVRAEHFRDEKAFLGEQFSTFLLERMRHFETVKHQRVVVLIDAGTTLVPLAECLAKKAVDLVRERPYLRSVLIGTNNIPAMLKVMEVGILDPKNRYSETVFRCELISGAPLPVYAAVSGPKATAAIDQLKQENANAHFIGIVTGNWVRLRGTNLRDDPRCPVPVARGDGHKEVKEAIVRAADEVYVVAPLGKIVGPTDNTENSVTNDSLNRDLGFSTENLGERKAYEDLTISGAVAARTKLVTTNRPDSASILHSASGRRQRDLSATFGDVDEGKKGTQASRPRVIEGEILLDGSKIQELATCERDCLPHFMYPFHIPGSFYVQRNIEFPHPHTRTVAFMQKYFSVRHPQ